VLAILPLSVEISLDPPAKMAKVDTPPPAPKYLPVFTSFTSVQAEPFQVSVLVIIPGELLPE
jgi:hypothetical protein